MNRLFFSLLFLLSAKLLYAQSDTVALSLPDAIQKALQNRYELKIQQTNVRISENEVRKINSKNLPQVSGDMDLRVNTQLQTSIIPGQALGPPGSPDRKIQFGTRYNTLLGLNVTQSLFNPGVKGDKEIANAQTDYQRLNEKVTETQIKQQVTEAYFSTLLWQERAALSSSNVKRTKGLFVMAESQLKEGVITSYDLQRYRIDLENAKAEDQKNRQNRDLAFYDLWYKIGEDTVKATKLTEDIQALYAAYSNDYSWVPALNRTELQMEKTQNEIYKLNIKKQNLSYLPSINLYGSYYLQQLTNKFGPFNTDNWYPFNYFGLKASIPIYDGSLKSRTKNEYRLRTELSRLNYEKLKNDYTQESRNALTSLKNAEADLTYQKKNLDLADELYKIDTDRLQNGIIRQSDLTTTYYTLQQTQNNYLNALYNYLLSVVQYKKAAGVL